MQSLFHKLIKESYSSRKERIPTKSKIPHVFSVLLGSCALCLGSLDAKEINREETEHAADTVAWKNDTTGDWNDDRNWQDGAAPTQYNDVKIDHGTANVGSGDRGFYENMSIGSGTDNSGTLNVGAEGKLRGTSDTSLGEDGGTGTIVMKDQSSWINDGDVNLGIGQGSTGKLVIEKGKVEVTNNLTVGRDGGNGTVDMDGGSLGVQNHLILGLHGGDGTMTTKNNARVDVGLDLDIGLSGTGTLDMNGGSIEVQKRAFIGNMGEGTMKTNNTQVAVKHSINVGSSAGIGKLEMNGGSLVGSDLFVGFLGGKGTVTLNNVQTDIKTDMRIGSRNSIGTFEMSGGNLDIGKNLNIGYGGEGTMTLNNVQTNVKNNLNVGTDQDSIGTLELSEGNFNVGNLATIGNNGGKGEWTIKNDARADVGGLIVGHKPGSAGTLEIDGRDGIEALNVRDGTSIGQEGNGTVKVHKGEVKTTGATTIGWNNMGDSAGLLAVDGTGKVNSDDIRLGYTDAANKAGTGTIKITDHGEVSANKVYIGSSEGSGSNSQGIVEVKDDGKFDATDLVSIGHNVNNSGSVTVTDRGAITAKDLIVGNAGTGKLIVQDNGTVNAANTLAVGNQSRGEGNLKIEGGKVSAQDVTFGNTADSSGSIELDGGILSTGSVRAYNDQHTFAWDGGTLQATRSNKTFINGFQPNTLTLGENGGIIDSNGYNIGINSEISGSGGLTKEGEGTLTFTKNQSYEGPTLINKGAVELNVKLTKSDVTIASDATLTGMGMVGGNVVNNGTLLPAWVVENPDTFTIQGNYTQGVEGKLEIPIIRDNYYSKVDVGGTAQLDGTVAPHFKKGYVPKSGTVFDIVTAAEGVQGEFNHVALDGALQMDAIYDDTTAKLIVRQERFTGRTATQKSIAEALNETLDNGLAGTEGALGTFVWNLEFVPHGEEFQYLDQLAPFQAATIKDILFNATNMQYGQITNRLGNIRMGANGASFNGINTGSMEQQIAAHEKSVKDKDGKTIAYSNVETSPWSIFATASGIFSNMANVSDLPRYNVTTGYFSTGADLRLSENLHAGLYLGYQGTESKSGSNHLYGSGIKYGLYSTAQWDGFYINAILGGGNTGYNLHRTIGIADDHWAARSSPSSAEFDSLLGGGYEWKLGNWRLGANASLQYTYAGISAFKESGADTLNVWSDRQNVGSLVSTLGANFSYIWNIAPGYQIIPTVGIGWQYEYLNNGQNIAAAFNNGAGPRFNYATTSGDRNTAFGTVGVGAQLGKHIGSYVYYTPQLGSKITSHGVLLGINYNF